MDQATVNTLEVTPQERRRIILELCSREQGVTIQEAAIAFGTLEQHKFNSIFCKLLNEGAIHRTTDKRRTLSGSSAWVHYIGTGINDETF